MQQFNEQAEAAHERADIIRKALKYGTLTITGIEELNIPPAETLE
jgi:hypothetical protein